MIGAVIGDIVGSRFEWKPQKSTEFELFNEDSRFTDDSVMSLALGAACVAALQEQEKAKSRQSGANSTEHWRLEPQILAQKAIEKMQEFGRRYPEAGYGGRFKAWLTAERPEAYQSFGNGSAMRISSVAAVARSEEELKAYVRAVTEITHNHPEGIKGAEATALAIFLAREGASKAELRERISAEYYPLDFSLAEIRPSYSFDVTCQGSVPQAIMAFLEADDFITALRNAVSLGGDSDTQAAISGSIAEAYYPIPEDLRQEALGFLDHFLLQQLLDFESCFQLKSPEI